MIRISNGFTLVELLIVIGIIAILATFSVIGITEAQKKAKDTKRITQMRELAMALDSYNAETASYVLQGCTVGGNVIQDCMNPPGFVTDFSRFRDPEGGNGVACSSQPAQTACQYAIGNAEAKTDNYAICFRTQSSTAIGAKGNYYISPGGRFRSGCPN